MLSKLTLVGLNEYSQGKLWENLELPEGYDVEVFINEVIKHGGEFPLLYADLDFMKFQVGAWSRKWFHTFERWLKADNFEYEALYNLDVKATIEEIGENHSIKGGTSNGNATHSKAAYDSNVLEPVDSTSNYVRSDSNDDSDHKVVTEEYRRGNQGITMSQEMLDAERNVWMWNIYNHMADLFVNEYCICLYV